MGQEISNRVRCARMWCQRHWEVLCNPTVRSCIKFQLYKLFVRPLLTYRCEVWTLDRRSSKKLERFEQEILLEIYKSKYPHRHPKRLRPNIRLVYQKYRNTDILEYIENERLDWTSLLELEKMSLKCQNCTCEKHVKWWDDPQQGSSRRNRRQEQSDKPLREPELILERPFRRRSNGQTQDAPG